LFIEDSLPDIDLFIKNKQSIVLGTDSYCSNTALSILEEMKTINLNFHHIDFSEILRWATINGAKALGFDNTIGSFEYGKKPGINLIENFDFEKMALTEKSSVTKVL
jgi:cytosine/adenosine deaminase-related metal-dependent hydrolase